MILQNLIPLKSSYLHSAGYDPDGHRLAIRFRSGLVRFYAEPVQKFQALMSADSPGRYFNLYISRKKKSERLGTLPGSCVPSLQQNRCTDYSGDGTEPVRAIQSQERN